MATKQIDLDRVHSRAITQQVGQRLRAELQEPSDKPSQLMELLARLKAQEPKS
jgi:hypothetical protein